MEHRTDDHNDSWLDGAPTWVRVVQAVLIGLVAGLALHALLSMVVLQGSETTAPNAEASPESGTVPPSRIVVEVTPGSALEPASPTGVRTRAMRRESRLAGRLIARSAFSASRAGA